MYDRGEAARLAAVQTQTNFAKTEASLGFRFAAVSEAEYGRGDRERAERYFVLAQTCCGVLVRFLFSHEHKISTEDHEELAAELQRLRSTLGMLNSQLSR